MVMDDRTEDKTYQSKCAPSMESLEHRLLLTSVISDLQIVDDTVIYKAQDGNQYGIFMYNDDGLRQITSSTYEDLNPHTDGVNVVWQDIDPIDGDTEIFLYDGNTVRQISNNSFNDTEPKTDGNIIAWYSKDGNQNDVHVYGYEEDRIIFLNDDSYDAKGLQVCDGRAVWYAKVGSDNEVFLYSDGSDDQITDNGANESKLGISPTHISWRATDSSSTGDDDDGDGESDGDEEVYLYKISTGEIKRITQNTTVDTSPCLSNTTLFWIGEDPTDGDKEIFSYNYTDPEAEIVQLTFNDTNETVLKANSHGGIWQDNSDPFNPQIHGKKDSENNVSPLTNDSSLHNHAAASGDKLVWTDDLTVRLLDTTNLEPLVEFTNFGYSSSNPTLTIDDIVVPESNKANLDLEILVRLSAPTDHEITFSYSTEGITAVTDGSGGSSGNEVDDFVSTSGTLTFLPGDVGRSITVTVLGDTKIELDETFRINITDVQGDVNLNGTSAIITLADDDTPDVEVMDAEVIEMNTDGTCQLGFRIKLSSPVLETMSVYYTTVDIAEDGDDETDDEKYLARSGDGEDYKTEFGTCTFEKGDQPSKIIYVTVYVDDISEAHEKFEFKLSNPNKVNIIDDTAIGTILNDDVEISFDDSSQDLSRDEGDDGEKNFTFRVNLSNPSAMDVSVEYETKDSTVDNENHHPADSDDYETTSGLLEFAPGDTYKTFTVTVYGDEDIEKHELFNVLLKNAFNADIAGNSLQTTGEIFDDDAPRLTISDVSVVEGAPLINIYNHSVTEGDEDDQNKQVNIKLTLSRAIDEDVTVKYTIFDGTAKSDGENADYFADSLTGSVTFAANQTEQYITVDILGDNTFEGNEYFNIRLERIDGNAEPGENSVAKVTIYNDDYNTTAPRLYCYDYQAYEGDTDNEGPPDTRKFTVVVGLSEPVDYNVVVNYTLSDATGKVNEDYFGLMAPVTILAGQRFATIDDIYVYGDNENESNKTFRVNITTSSGVVVADPMGQVTIIDDDTAENYIEFTVTLNEPDPEGRDIEVNYATEEYLKEADEDDDDAPEYDMAESDTDYQETYGTLTFHYDDDAPELSHTIRVPIYGDRDIEKFETFKMTLSDATHEVKIINEFGTAILENDDTEISFEVDSIEKKEGDSGTTIFDFYLKMTEQIDREVTVYFSTIDDTAISVVDNDDDTVDFIARDYYSVTFTKDDRPDDDDSEVETEYYARLTVSVRGDKLIEADENFYVELLNAIGAKISGIDEDPENAIATATILDDDTPYVSISDVEIIEGDAPNTKQAVLTVTLSRENDLQDVVVNYETAIDDSDGASAATAGDDYTAITNGEIIFAPGETSKTITIVIIGDDDSEADETFLVKLSCDEDAGAIANDEDDDTTADDDTAVVTIKNDDTGIIVDNIEVSEGTSNNNTTARLTARLTNASTDTVTVYWYTIDGTAISEDSEPTGADYEAIAGMITFLPGQTSQDFTVSIIADSFVETGDGQNEYFYIKLYDPTNATILNMDETATVEIKDDDVPRLRISDAKVIEGDGDEVYMEFTVTKQGTIDDIIEVYYSTTTGSATGDDFTGIQDGLLEFTAGNVETTKTFTIPISGDFNSEADETFTVTISTPDSNKAIVVESTATGTIQNDDGLVYLDENDIVVKEGDDGTTSQQVTLRLEHPSKRDTSVNVSSLAGTATEGQDYTAINQLVTIPAGETFATFNFNIIGDRIFEGNEDFQFNLSAMANGQIATGSESKTVTIQEDDEAPEIYIEQANVIEGDYGTTYMEVIVSLSNPSELEVGATLETQTDTSVALIHQAAVGTDYTYTKVDNITFLPYETSVTVNIPISGDTTIEPDEYFLINLSNASNAKIENAQTQAVIRNDDTIINISGGDKITEQDSGNQILTYTLTLSEATSFDVSVHYSTQDITATAGADYVAANDLVVEFLAGQTSKTINIPIIGDNISEGNEQFKLLFSQAKNAKLSVSEITTTIEDNEPTPELTISDTQITEGNSGTANVLVTLSLSNPASWDISVDYATSPLSATQTSDYINKTGTVTFLAGQTQKQISISIVGDTVIEPSETFTVELTNLTPGVTMTDAQAIITIADDDSMGNDNEISISDAEIEEKHSGQSLIVFTISLAQAAESNINISYSTADGTATLADGDYNYTSQSTWIYQGSSETTIGIVINGDTASEANEIFYVNITGASGGVIVDSQAIGTIINDDGLPDLSIEDLSVSEIDTGTSTASIILTLSSPAGSDITMDWTATGATAAEGEDFIAAGGTFTIPAGSSSAQLNVDIVGDTIFEGHEYFTVSVSNIVGANGIDTAATITILDNDPLPEPMGDLELTVKKMTVPATACPGQVIKTQYSLSNMGNANSTGKVSVSLYWSTDLILDQSDGLLTETKMGKINLKPGKSKQYNINVKVPDTAPEGNWYLIAHVNTEDDVSDFNLTNNTITAEQTFASPWQFGQLPNGAKITLPVHDSTGQDVKLMLNGGGWGEVIGGDDFTQILLHDTTDKSTLIIKAKNEIKAGALIADSPVRVINALNLSLSANSNFTAFNIKLNDISEDATISLGDFGKPVTITLGEVLDGSLQSQSEINKLIVENWLDSNSSGDQLNSPLLKALQSKGDFAANVNSDGLKNALIKGNLSGDLQFDSAVNITVNGDMAADMQLGNAGNIIIKGNMDAGMQLGSANNILVNGNMTAEMQLGNVNNITIKGDMNLSELLLTDPDAKKSLNTLNVKGDINSSSIVAASNINTILARGIYSSDVFAGFNSVAGRRAENAADFDAQASINKIVTRGAGRSTDRYVSDSNFSAAEMGVIKLINADFASSQITINALGAVSGKEIRKVTHTDKLDKNYNWVYPPSKNQSFDDPYDVIRIL